MVGMGFTSRVLLLLLALGPCSAKADEGVPLSLFVSILPQKYITERIGGAHVRVHVMVPPGASPATYEPTPRQMVLLAGVRLYYRIGVPFEHAWMERIVGVNGSMRILDGRDGISMRRMGAADDEDQGHEHGHGHGGPDPHIWLSPLRMRAMGARLNEVLQGLDPAHREDYQRNFEALSAELEALDTELRGILGNKRGRSFMVFHPSWGYFADDYGLHQVAIEREGKEPGGRTLARLIEGASRRGVATVFVERQFSQERARALARAIGARVVVLDPLAEDYIANMRAVAHAVAEAAYE